MKKARIRGIIHLTGRLREGVSQNMKRKTLITEGILGITPETSLEPTSKMKILKETCSRVQAQEKKGNHLLAIIITIIKTQLREDP